MLKTQLKKIIPNSIFVIYYWLIAYVAAIYYGLPAKKLIIIGVTGTKGKTSTANFVWSVLTDGGYKVGMVTTANIRIGHVERLNPYHMTMPGRFTLQKILDEMVSAGCRYAVVEVTSEGIKQYRHLGLYPDVAIFTSLWPEHLPSHGSFENYRAAKGQLFHLLSSHHKVILGERVPKVIVANHDSEHKDYFLNFTADKKITFGFGDGADYQASKIKEVPDGVTFTVGTQDFKIGLVGQFNVYNALPAIVLGYWAGLEPDLIKKGLAGLITIPGRMELINESQNFEVYVDYAHERQSLTNVLTSAQNRKAQGARVIVLLGAEGGGRDKTKRPAMGEVAAHLADYVVVSNVDPYYDDPGPILEDIAEAAEVFGKIRDENLLVIEDRREGIRAALKLAQPGDIVIITGKGAEQSIIIGGVSSPWDDRVVVRDELQKILVA